MILPDVLDVRPSGEGSLRSGVGEILAALKDRIDGSDGGIDRVLALTFFANVADDASYRGLREDVDELLAAAFPGERVPASVVAQPPEGGLGLALEAAVLDGPADAIEVRRGEVDGTPYTVATGPDVRLVAGAGIGGRPEIDGTGARARDAFATMAGILRREGLGFGHVIRQWNYVEGLLDVRREDGRTRQGYQALNDARTQAYAGSDFPTGYPAATGIGQSAGGVLLEFVALDGVARVSAVSNPKQVDAHRYSTSVLIGEPPAEGTGKTAPKFERAKRVVDGSEEAVLVSGTASIRGERSVAPGDVAAQTRTTIENVAALVGDRPLTRLRGYVKNIEDAPVVRRICEEAYGPVPALFVQADVCRDELLVELEGALRVREPVPDPIAEGWR